MPEEANITLGKQGMMYTNYLEKHANEMFVLLIEQMQVNEGVTEESKEENQMEWIQRMGNIEARAREIVCEELIYV